MSLAIEAMATGTPSSSLINESVSRTVRTAPDLHGAWFRVPYYFTLAAPPCGGPAHERLPQSGISISTLISQQFFARPAVAPYRLAVGIEDDPLQIFDDDRVGGIHDHFRQHAQLMLVPAQRVNVDDRNHCPAAFRSGMPGGNVQRKTASVLGLKLPVGDPCSLQHLLDVMDQVRVVNDVGQAADAVPNVLGLNRKGCRRRRCESADAERRVDRDGADAGTVPPAIGRRGGPQHGLGEFDRVTSRFGFAFALDPFMSIAGSCAASGPISVGRRSLAPNPQAQLPAGVAAAPVCPASSGFHFPA